MRKWKGLPKVAEECGELVQELMKLTNYPDGKHPRRKKSLVLTTQEEAGDVLAALGYFLEKNGLDLAAVEKRRAMKFRKWVKRYGETPAMMKAKKKAKKKATKKATKRAMKKSSEVQIVVANASHVTNDTKTT
jgi:NTP pyrophosphatase (non-canonical NTP hydrolase)